MKTKYLNSRQISEAARILKSGGLVAIPTETVYGLAANAFDEQAISKIFSAKGRPSDNPLIVHISDLSELNKVVSDFPPQAQLLAEKFWPGPLTIILPKNENIPDIVSGGMNSVAVRFPSNETAQLIIKSAGCPLVAPSANLSGRPSPTKFQHVVDDLGGRVDAIVDGGDCNIGLESTVVSLMEEVPRLLRPGAVSAEDIKKVLGELVIDNAVFNEVESNQKVLSPGMKYKHYSPDAEVFLVKGSRESYIRFINSLEDKHSIALCFEEDIPFVKIPYISYGKAGDAYSQARNLFDALRKSDKIYAKKVYARFELGCGIAAAVYNRLIRAAGFKELDISHLEVN